MAEKKSKKKQETIPADTEKTNRKAVMTSKGDVYEVTGETGKYYICGDKQFSVTSPFITVCEL